MMSSILHYPIKCIAYKQLRIRPDISTAIFTLPPLREGICLLLVNE